MSTMTVREIPEDLQHFLKADDVAIRRSVNRKVMMALKAYRDAELAQVPRATTPAEKMAAMNLIPASIHLVVVQDRRTGDEIIGHNEPGCFD